MTNLFDIAVECSSCLTILTKKKKSFCCLKIFELGCPICHMRSNLTDNSNLLQIGCVHDIPECDVIVSFGLFNSIGERLFFKEIYKWKIYRC